MSLPRPLVDYPRYRRASNALHKLWSRDVGRTDYNKKQWGELEAAIHLLATDGVEFPSLLGHALWLRDLGTPGYTEAPWRELEAAIRVLAAHGVGEPG